MNVATNPSVSESEEIDTRPWKFVVHNRPDPDAWACLWGAVTCLARHENYVIEYIPAGTSLPADKVVGYRVVQMDTGKGELDQHGKELKRTSSFELFCKKYQLDQDPAMCPLIEMTIASDNVEELKRTDIAYVLKGLAYYYKDDDNGGAINWEAARIFAFAALDILYSQAKERVRNRDNYQKHKDVCMLHNGIRVANLWFRPGTRDAAFEDGNDVVVYFAKRGGEKFYPIIQVNRASNIVLDRVAFALRKAEARKRDITTRGIDLWAIGSHQQLGGWYYHDSRKMLACGTNGHELKGDEFTKQGPTGIFKEVCSALESITRS